MSDSVQPIPSGPRTSVIGRALACLGFAAVIAAGAALGISNFGPPLRNMLAARHWRSASCQIISAGLTHLDHAHDQENPGQTFRVDVTYRYVVGDRGYHGDRYQFVSAASTGFDGKAAIVARLRAEKRAECWVNPADPNDAVIERGPTIELWYMLVPVLFVAIGVTGIYFTTVGRRSRLFQKQAGTSRTS
jgi:hypothetical protein